MVKTHTTLNIESELKDKAKELGLNMSELLENALKSKIGSNTNEELKELLNKFQDFDIEVQLAIKRIKDEFKRREDSMSARKDYLEKTYGKMTEIFDITEEQLHDMDFLNKLIDMLRAKYNNRFICGKDIIEYHETNKEGSE